eukprot:RCo035491
MGAAGSTNGRSSPKYKTSSFRAQRRIIIDKNAPAGANRVARPANAAGAEQSGATTTTTATAPTPGSQQNPSQQTQPTSPTEETPSEDNNSDAGAEQMLMQDLFVYSDFSVDTAIASADAAPASKYKRRIAHGSIKLDPLSVGGITLASLTIPLAIKTEIVEKHMNRMNQLNLRFEFSDFGIVLTEDELNEEIIRKAGGTFKSLKVPQLLEAKNNKVAKILNYSVSNLLGRSSRIRCLMLTPDERRLVTCSHDEQILSMYDLHTGLQVLQFVGHEDMVMSLTISPDSKFLVSGSRDETVIMWDISTAKQVHVLQHSAMVISVDYSRDGARIVCGCQDKTCHVWDARSGKESVVFEEHTGLVICVAFSPDSFLVASASADRTVLVWDSRTSRRRHTLKGHTGVVLSCAFSEDNLRIVSNDEKNVLLWNSRNGSLLKSFDITSSPVLQAPSAASAGGKHAEVKFILSSFTPGSHILATCNNKVVQLWDPNTGTETLSLSFRSSVYCCACGRYNTFALGDANGNIYIIRLMLDSDVLSLPPSALTAEMDLTAVD